MAHQRSTAWSQRIVPLATELTRALNAHKARHDHMQPRLVNETVHGLRAIWQRYRASDDLVLCHIKLLEAHPTLLHVMLTLLQSLLVFSRLLGNDLRDIIASMIDESLTFIRVIYFYKRECGRFDDMFVRRWCAFITCPLFEQAVYEDPVNARMSVLLIEDKHAAALLSDSGVPAYILQQWCSTTQPSITMMTYAFVIAQFIKHGAFVMDSSATETVVQQLLATWWLLTWELNIYDVNEYFNDVALIIEGAQLKEQHATQLLHCIARTQQYFSLTHHTEPSIVEPILQRCNGIVQSLLRDHHVGIAHYMIQNTEPTSLQLSMRWVLMPAYFDCLASVAIAVLASWLLPTAVNVLYTLLLAIGCRYMRPYYYLYSRAFVYPRHAYGIINGVGTVFMRMSLRLRIGLLFGIVGVLSAIKLTGGVPALNYGLTNMIVQTCVTRILLSQQDYNGVLWHLKYMFENAIAFVLVSVLVWVVGGHSIDYVVGLGATVACTNLQSVILVVAPRDHLLSSLAWTTLMSTIFFITYHYGHVTHMASLSS
jgi:hypothetical protein